MSPLVFCEIIKMSLASEPSTAARKDIFIGKKLPSILETLSWLWLLVGLFLPTQLPLTQDRFVDFDCEI